MSYRTLATHLIPKLSATVIGKEADLYNKDYIFNIKERKNLI